MKRLIIVVTALTALAVPVGSASAQPNERAGCVGVFSSFFAHDGFGMHRSEVAQGYAHGEQPAGSVYSHVAEFHGSLGACFQQTS